jgi:hypothetical protein
VRVEGAGGGAAALAGEFLFGNGETIIFVQPSLSFFLSILPTLAT